MATPGSGRTPGSAPTNGNPGISPVPFPGFSPTAQGSSPATPAFRPGAPRAVERLAGLSGTIPGSRGTPLQTPNRPGSSGKGTGNSVRPGFRTGTPPLPSGGMKARGRGKGGSPPSVVMAEATPAPKRKKRKLADKRLPHRVSTFIPESKIYSQLLEFEKRVDATITRKKLDIQEALRQPQRVARTLRLYIVSTYEEQPQHGVGVSWLMTLTGRLLEHEGQKEAEEQPKFSSFFKKVTIQLDPVQYPGASGTVVWEAAKAAQGHVDAFEVKRIGSREFKARVTLEMNYVPERFRVAPKLAVLLNMEVETRPRIVSALWQYIKQHKLQDPDDPLMITPDAPLREIFSADGRLRLAGLASRLGAYLSPAPAIVLEHQIRLSGPNSGIPDACFDIAVDIPPPLQKEMGSFLAGLERHRDIEALDETISSTIRKVNEHRRRRAFFLGFSHSPVDFIHGLMASQSRDLRLAAGTAGRNADKESRSEFYTQPWVEDAVVRYLNRRLATGADAAKEG